jgi:hypothetical protein
LVHVAAAASEVALRFHRCLTVIFFTAGSLLLTAVGHVLASTSASASSMSTLQCGFAILRSVVSLVLMAVERRMRVAALLEDGSKQPGAAVKDP